MCRSRREFRLALFFVIAVSGIACGGDRDGDVVTAGVFSVEQEVVDLYRAWCGCHASGAGFADAAACIEELRGDIPPDMQPSTCEAELLRDHPEVASTLFSCMRSAVQRGAECIRSCTEESSRCTDGVNADIAGCYGSVPTEVRVRLDGCAPPVDAETALVVAADEVNAAWTGVVDADCRCHAEAYGYGDPEACVAAEHFLWTDDPCIVDALVVDPDAAVTHLKCMTDTFDALAGCLATCPLDGACDSTDRLEACWSLLPDAALVRLDTCLAQP